MLVELKQNTFRFLILSHINDLLISKGLIINSIKRAVAPFNTPKTLKEIDEGGIPAVDPYFTKKIDQILRDLNSFAVVDEDLYRMSASESTLDTELRVSTPVSKIVDQKFMLKSIWGYINKDDLGTDLTAALESSFNDYIGVCRNIATWAMMLHQKQNDAIVMLGASSVSFLSPKWGPVCLSDDLDNFYNQLFEHIYFYALEGKILALLDCMPVGIAIHQVTKSKVKFDDYGYVDIKSPMNKSESTYPNSKFYITDIDFLVVEDSCGVPEVTIDKDLELCSDSVALRIKEYEGMPICTAVKPMPPFYPTPIIDPPITYMPISPPAPPLLPILNGCIAVAFYFDCTGNVPYTTYVGDANGIMDNYVYWGAAEGTKHFINNVMTNCDAFSATIRANHALTVKSMSRDKGFPGKSWDCCNHWCGFDVYVALELAINEAMSVPAVEYDGGRHIVVVTYGAAGWSTGERWGWGVDYQTITLSQQARVDYRNALVQRIKDNDLTLHIISGTNNKALTQLVKDTGGSYHSTASFNEALLAMTKKVPEAINRKIGRPFQPTASFTMTDITGLDAPQLIDFTNADEEGASYSWSFGDGTFSNEINPSHEYTVNGTYTVILRSEVTGDGGTVLSSISEQTLKLGRIYTLPLKAGMVCYAREGWSPLTVNFYNDSEGLYHSLLWNFGDGSISTDVNPVHIYTTIGTFKPYLTITNTTSGESNTFTPDWSITVSECFELRVVVDVTITVLEKFNFSYDMLIGVTLQKLLFPFVSFKDNCSIDIVSGVQQLPKDLRPVAVIDLKYAEIKGTGKYDSPIKIGEDVKWNETGLLRYEVIPADPYSIKLTFNARTAFPSPSNPNIVIAKTTSYLFTKDTNVLGIKAPDNTSHLIVFKVYDKVALVTNSSSSKDYTGSTSYTTLEVCAILNEAFDGTQLISYPDKYNKLVIASLSDSPISILSKAEGSTANEVFGFHSSGDLGIPIIGAGNVEYKVALYVACVLNEGSSPFVEYAISKLIGKHRVISNQFKVISPNYFEAIYGTYPKIISNRVFLPPGHRYIHHSNVTLSNIEETTNIPVESRELESGFFEDSTCYNAQTVISTAQWSPAIAQQYNLFSPYWVGMVCDSKAYPANVDLWMDGDDKRFYTGRSLDTKNNCLEFTGHYDFMAPTPVIRNQITARKKGPYTLSLDPGRSRMLAIRKIAVSNHYVTATLTEGVSNSPSLDYVGYIAGTQVVQINVGYLENQNKPSFSPRILTTPYAVWSNGEAATLTGIWEGVGTSFLSCVINPYHHSGDTLSIGYWVDFSDPETMQLDDWSYIELPFGYGTVDEIIHAMKRDGDWLRANKSKMYWTQSTTYLNASNYVIFKDHRGDFQSTYQLIDVEGRLRLKTSVDFDFRIRLGGSPENCFANDVFGWNPLGELGDKVVAAKGPYYTYTYSLDTYVTKDLHPSVGSLQPNYHESDIVKYKEVYSNFKQTFLNEGLPIKDLYEWRVCGYSLVKQSTMVNYYLDLLEKMFSSICPVRKGGTLPPSEGVVPVVFPIGIKTVEVSTLADIKPAAMLPFEDFVFLLEEADLIAPDLLEALKQLLEGVVSEESEIKFDLPWYDPEKVFQSVATDVKALLCGGSISTTQCNTCDSVVTTNIVNPELLDLSCAVIENEPIVYPPTTMDCAEFYSVSPLLLEPIKALYVPVSTIEYYPCSCNNRVNPLITITHEYTGKNTLYATISTVEYEAMYLEKDYVVDMHLNDLIATIPLEDSMAIMGVYINDVDSMSTVKKMTLDYKNNVAIFEMCDVISNQYTIRSGVLINCYPLSGITDRQYVFESSLHGTVTVIIPSNRTQITPEYFAELLSTALSPFAVNIVNNRITVDPGNHSVRITTLPTVDLLSLEEVLLYDNPATEIEVGTSLEVGDTFVGEEVLSVKITLFYAFVQNSSSDNLSAFISG